MKTVLVVDDEKELRELLQETLEMRGFKCLTAENGEEAVKIANKENISLIITDLIMPVLDGIGTYKALKARDKTKNIPIIVYSAQPSEIVAKKGFEVSDVIDFLIKPFDVEELINSIIKAIGTP